MRLLHTETLELAEFIGETRPEFAILSHTWGDGEILFQDVQGGHKSLLASNKAGLDKVLRAAAVARQNNFKYIWIDTCCIDKSSSAELSEAINSMFAWYNKAAVCYAYIADYDSTDAKLLSAANRWFQRGWTLQELIAPTRVDFYDKNWICFGDRVSLVKVLSGVTKIDELALRWHPEPKCSAAPVMSVAAASAREAVGRSSLPRVPCKFCYQGVPEMLDSISVATRMSWAADRRTTREEDTAYSLLGIFGVNMPLLYGEGPGAFLRLQHEIVRNSPDQSIFACEAPPRPVRQGEDLARHKYTPTPASWQTSGCGTRLFAESPSWFRHSLDLPIDKPLGPVAPMLLSSVGVEVDLYIAPCDGHVNDHCIGILHRTGVRHSLSSPDLLLQSIQSTSRIPSFRRKELPNGQALFQVTAGSNKASPRELEPRAHVSWATLKFDPGLLQRKRVLLQDLNEDDSRFSLQPQRNFIPPPFRVRVLEGFQFHEEPTPADFPDYKYSPSTVVIQASASTTPRSFRPGGSVVEVLDEKLYLMKTTPNIVCGIASVRLSRTEGFVIHWGINRRHPRYVRYHASLASRSWEAIFHDKWWEHLSNPDSWYTAVYPWKSSAAPGNPDADTMAEEMTSFWSVQAMLDRCCDDGVSLTNASDLIHHPDGGCERKWAVLARNLTFERTRVRVTITPVDFLGRRVMDIAATVSRVEELN